MAFRFGRKRTKGRKKSKPISLGDILPVSLQSNGLQKDYYRWQIFSLWNDIIGKQIAIHAQPEKIFRGTLTINVKNSAWIQELQFMKREIMDRINREIINRKEHQKEQLPLDFPQIKNIRFQLGKPVPRQEKPTLTPKRIAVETSAPLQSNERIQAEESADTKTRSINDPEMREILKNFLVSTTKPRK